MESHIPEVGESVLSEAVCKIICVDGCETYNCDTKKMILELINRKVSETLDRLEAALPKGSFYTPESLEGKIYWEAIAEVKKAISKIRGLVK